MGTGWAGRSRSFTIDSMETTLHPSGRRTGATWVAATGAFMFLAAAAVFVAVQWDRMDDVAKLAVVTAVTSGFLVAGRALRPTLPATGDVLFHLGVLLVPVDVAGTVLRLGLGWRVLLLAEGAVGAAFLGGVGLATGSVVLRWAGIASLPVLACGLAAITPVSAPLWLALTAVLLEVVGHPPLRRPAVVAAAVAGLGPVLGPVAWGVTQLAGRGIGSGTLADLGLAGGAQVMAAGSGSVAAAVLARQAHRLRDVRLAFLAFASAAVGVAVALLAARLDPAEGWVAAAAAFVLVEVVALALARDPFWAGPADGLARLVEPGAAVGPVVAALVLLLAPFGGVERDAGAAAVLGLVAFGFAASEVRRRQMPPAAGDEDLLRAACAALCAVAALAAGSGSVVATSAGLVAVGAGLVALPRLATPMAGAAFAAWALVTAGSHPLAGLLVGLAGAAVVAEAAVVRFRVEGAGGPWAPVLAVVSALVAAGAFGLVAYDLLGPAGATAGAVGACWLAAARLDTGGPRLYAAVPRLYAPSLHLGDLARGVSALPAAAALSLAPEAALVPLSAATLLSVLEAARLRRPEVALVAALSVQGVVVEVARASGVEGAELGVATAVAAVAWAGLATVVEGWWRLPFVAAAALGLALGLAGAADDPAAFADVLVVTGGLGIGVGVVARRPLVAHGGAVAVTAGLFVHLALGGVGAVEPYLAPVALQLAVAGWQAQRQAPISSWLAQAPAVALLGGGALAERLAGGEGWHALVAGGVAVVAVVAGGWLRLMGPLLVGSALAAALTVHEMLSTLAGVPTWAWLATGGSLLLAAGIVLERTDVSPAEAGRRVVDVVAERFR